MFDALCNHCVSVLLVTEFNLYRLRPQYWKDLNLEINDNDKNVLSVPSSERFFELKCLSRWLMQGVSVEKLVGKLCCCREATSQWVRYWFDVVYLHNIVGPCYRWVWVPECWNFFPDLLTYVSTWGLRQFLIWGHLILRPEAGWECLRSCDLQTKCNV